MCEVSRGARRRSMEGTVSPGGGGGGWLASHRCQPTGSLQAARPQSGHLPSGTKESPATHPVMWRRHPPASPSEAALPVPASHMLLLPVGPARSGASPSQLRVHSWLDLLSVATGSRGQRGAGSLEAAALTQPPGVGAEPPTPGTQDGPGSHHLTQGLLPTNPRLGEDTWAEP